MDDEIRRQGKNLCPTIAQVANTRHEKRGAPGEEDNMQRAENRHLDVLSEKIKHRRGHRDHRVRQIAECDKWKQLAGRSPVMSKAEWNQERSRKRKASQWQSD